MHTGVREPFTSRLVRTELQIPDKALHPVFARTRTHASSRRTRHTDRTRLRTHRGWEIRITLYPLRSAIGDAWLVHTVGILQEVPAHQRHRRWCSS